WTRTLAAGVTSSPLTVKVPEDADPDGQFVLVFQGALGNETGAVVGRVVEIKDNSWSYLIIKQISQETSSEAFFHEGSSEFGGEKISKFINFSTGINFIEWEFEWLGKPAEIVSIEIASYPSRWECTNKIIVSLTPSSNGKIEYINKQKNKGSIYANVKGAPFSPYLTVTTKDKNGALQYYSEPVFIAFSQVYTEVAFEAYECNEYSRRIYSNFRNHTRYSHMCVQLPANYGLENITPFQSPWKDLGYYEYNGGEYLYKEYRYGEEIRYGAGESWREYNDKIGSLLPLYPYTVTPLTIKRTWSSYTLNKLQSLGYDTTSLPEWNLYVDFVRLRK
ncbi:MAG: hypothetical protein P1P74_08190, partial [Desulfuromonadales bacterium]|nr:hypothetical protein [Desulfuromonadales bacterium]